MVLIILSYFFTLPGITLTKLNLDVTKYAWYNNAYSGVVGSGKGTLSMKKKGDE